jgi:hypothetical protein
MKNILEILIANIRTHLSDETLSDLVSGELAGGKLRRTQVHLSKCWKCRSRYEQLERAAMGFVGLHKKIITPNPPEASQWREMFLARLDQAAAETPSSSWSRLLPNFRFAGLTNMNPFLASAAVILGASVILFFIWQRSMPSVSASELMQRAESADRASAQSGKAGVIYQKVQIRTPQGFVEQDLYRDREGRRRPKAQPVAAEFTPLRAKLNIAGVSWDEPLSASSYKAWHDSQTEESDEVRRSGENLLTVTTKTSGGIVAGESLTVREEDFHPVKRTVELLDVGTVEITELNYAVLNWNAVNEDLFEPLAPTTAPVPPLNATIGPLLPPPPTPTQLLEAELQARVALHTLNADLGEEISVSHNTKNSVVVQGLIDTVQRKEQLASALNGIPYVNVQLKTLDGAASAQPATDAIPTTTVTLVSGSPALQEVLIQHFPNPDDRKAYVDRVLKLSDGTLAHAWALRRLEERYTSDDVAQLDQVGRQTLELLIRDHVAVIREQVSSEKHVVASVLSAAASVSTDSQADEALASGSDDWRLSIGEILDSSQALHETVLAMFSGTSATSADLERLSAKLQSALNGLDIHLSSLSHRVSGPFLNSAAQGNAAGPEGSHRRKE